MYKRKFSPSIVGQSKFFPRDFFNKQHPAASLHNHATLLTVSDFNPSSLRKNHSIEHNLDDLPLQVPSLLKAVSDNQHVQPTQNSGNNIEVKPIGSFYN